VLESHLEHILTPQCWSQGLMQVQLHTSHSHNIKELRLPSFYLFINTRFFVCTYLAFLPSLRQSSPLCAKSPISHPWINASGSVPITSPSNHKLVWPRWSQQIHASWSPVLTAPIQRNFEPSLLLCTPRTSLAGMETSLCIVKARQCHEGFARLSAGEADCPG